jgi:hypothetical protein
VHEWNGESETSTGKHHTQGLSKNNDFDSLFKIGGDKIRSTTDS